MMHCSFHVADKAQQDGIPPSACFKIAKICGSVYLLVFIKISSVIMCEKIPLLKPFICRGGLPSELNVEMDLLALTNDFRSDFRLPQHIAVCMG